MRFRSPEMQSDSAIQGLEEKCHSHTMSNLCHTSSMVRTPILLKAQVVFRNLLKNLLNLFEEITKETQSNSRPDPL